MSFSNRTAQALLNSMFGKSSNFGALASAPTIYVGLHGATTLASEATATSTSISVAFDVGDAAAVTIDPGGGNEESFDVVSVTGAGPYTVNIDGELAATHGAGTNVAFTPAEDGSNLNEPSGDGYARIETAAADWNEATAADPSVVTNAEALAMPEAEGDWLSGVKLTHATLHDAGSGGNFLGAGKLATAKPVFEEDTVDIKAGTLSVSLK